jgi:cephalosporin hydroxylase
MTDEELRDKCFKWLHEHNSHKTSRYRGIKVMKLASDLWNCQEIIFEHGIDYVLETGTFRGGSALWFADCLAMRGGKKVYTVDIHAPPSINHELLQFIVSSSTRPEMLDDVFAEVDGRLLVVLDSDHRASHVYKELCAIVPRMKSGDYLIVEDGVINGHPVDLEYGPGPWEGVEQYKAEFPGVLIPDLEREWKSLVTVAPNGFYTKA